MSILIFKPLKDQLLEVTQSVPLVLKAVPMQIKVRRLQF